MPKTFSSSLLLGSAFSFNDTPSGGHIESFLALSDTVLNSQGLPLPENKYESSSFTALLAKAYKLGQQNPNTSIDIVSAITEEREYEEYTEALREAKQKEEYAWMYQTCKDLQTYNFSITQYPDICYTIENLEEDDEDLWRCSFYHKTDGLLLENCKYSDDLEELAEKLHSERLKIIEAQ